MGVGHSVMGTSFDRGSAVQSLRVISALAGQSIIKGTLAALISFMKEGTKRVQCVCRGTCTRLFLSIC